MRTNLERAFSGRYMAEEATTGGRRAMNIEEYESGLVDALTNLMHFARRYEIDFDAAVASAENHHEIEATYDWGEEPGVDPKTPLPHNPLAG